MKKMIALIICLMLCLAALPVYAEEKGETAESMMEQAKALAKEMGVTVCDCYAKWKQMSQTQDVTKLLINRINHPTREMHELFAQMLFDTIFADGIELKRNEDDGMYCASDVQPNGVLTYQAFYR